MASTFGAAFDKLPQRVQWGIIESLRIRKDHYTRGLLGHRPTSVKIAIVGDRPGPGAMKLPANHHHTPFYSTKNSSLWLNRQLVEAGVDEACLFWVNAYDLHGKPTHSSHMSSWPNLRHVFLLGGNAVKWYVKEAAHCVPRFVETEHFFHPQAWKRFRSREAYPLIEALKNALDLKETKV